MSKQDKIEAAQKTKAARTEKAALLAPKAEVGKAEMHGVIKTLHTPEADRFWQIAGTTIFARKKEDLKDVRRSMNLEANTPEFVYEQDSANIEHKIRRATNSNTWRFRITKGPAHPAA